MEPNRPSGKTGWLTPTLPEKDETMLVLTRKQGEVIHIGEGVAIKVIKTGKGTVKIGIEAPADVKVLRGELSKKLEAEKSPRPAADEESKAVLFQRTAGRPVAVDFAGYFTLPQTA
jgi:carbon storage regulator